MSGAGSLFAIGQTADIAEQRFVEDRKDNQIDFTRAAISGGVNVASSFISAAIRGSSTINKQSILKETVSQTSEALVSDYIESEIIDRYTPYHSNVQSVQPEGNGKKNQNSQQERQNRNQNNANNNYNSARGGCGLYMSCL